MRQTILLCLCILICTTTLAQIKIDRQYFIQLLNQGRYNEVFTRAMEIRKLPYGKNAVIDYFIAKSLCMKGFRDESVEWLNYIYKQYPLQPEQRRFIVSESQSCRQPVQPATHATTPTFSSIIYINYVPLPEAGVMGKGGYTMDCHYNEQSSATSRKTLEELESRLFNENKKKEALVKIKTIVRNDYDVDTSGRFIVVSLKSKSFTSNDVQTVSKRLESAYQFFLSFYKLKPSDKLFTVYLVPNKYELRKTAQLVHDVALAQNIIGYSALGDLSLLGIAAPNSVGTLYHELFHLTIRTEVGDTPPWLDEGIACMYSVYELDGNILIGAKNTWRVNHFKLLTQLASKQVTVPTLEQLIAMRWDEFEGGKGKNICVASLHYALSNMFALFLQEKELVDEMVDAYKNRIKTRKDSLEVGATNTELVEMVTGKGMEELSSEFYKWLDQNYNIKLENIIKSHPYTSPDHDPGFQTFSEQEFPVHMEQAFFRIDSLIQQLRRDSSIERNKIDKFQQDRYTLKNEYRDKYSRLVYLYNNDLKTVDNPNSTSDNTEIKAYENQLAVVENKIQTLEKDLTTRIMQKVNNQ